MMNTFELLMIQKIKKCFRLSNTARKIFWVARIFDVTLPNFTNGKAIAPLSLSPTPMIQTMSMVQGKYNNRLTTKTTPLIKRSLIEICLCGGF